MRTSSGRSKISSQGNRQREKMAMGMKVHPSTAPQRLFTRRAVNREATTLDYSQDPSITIQPNPLLLQGMGHYCKVRQ